EADLRELHQMVDQAGDVLSAIQNTQKELEKANSYVQTWQTDAPNLNELAPLFGQITQLAKQAGLTPTRFSPGNRTPCDRVAKIPLSINCQGSFTQIYDFLYKLESLAQIVWIERFTIEKSREDSQQLQCEINLVIFTDNSGNSDQTKDSQKPI
ncbi:MAG TPA: type 4a pilus biogenesis protein PilO, partial [Thermoguttaceae bacterium]|nr:type 4a pilus biogenesis protein PilO [Thermoguttaceae bacterium]